MPISGSDSYGNLYVEYRVILPLELSPKMRQSECLPPPVTMNLMSIPNPYPLGLDRTFNGDYSEGKKEIRDEL